MLVRLACLVDLGVSRSTLASTLTGRYDDEQLVCTWVTAAQDCEVKARGREMVT